MNNASAVTRQQRRYNQRQEKKGIAKPQKNAFHRAMTTAKQAAEAVRAAMNLGPIAQKLAMMDLAVKLGQYKSRGKGRGTPARNHLRPVNDVLPHQGPQERLRRAVGGWGFRSHFSGLTKLQTFRLLVAKKAGTLRGAIDLVRGLPVSA